MANTLRFKRGLVSGIPTAAAGEPLFTTDTFDLYIGNGSGNTRFQKYIASGATTQILRGDGSLYTFPLAISSPSNGQVLKFNGTNWVNDSDAGITGSAAAGQVSFFTGATTLGGSNNLFWDATNARLGVGTTTPSAKISINGTSTDSYILNFIRQFGVEGSLFTDGGGIAITQGLLSEAGIYLSRNSRIDFRVNGSERMRLHSTGNLVLGGTTSSDNGARLQVSGTSTFSNSVGIGTTNLTGVSLRVNKALTGGTTVVGIYHTGQVQSDVTSTAYANYNVLSTADASFTLPNYFHYGAEQGTIGAGSSVTNQYGFYAFSTLIGATNNYGFYGNIASGTGRWNLYMNGSANNYVNGRLLVGTTGNATQSAKVIIDGSSQACQLELVGQTSNGGYIAISSGGAAKGFFGNGSNVGLSSVDDVALRSQAGNLIFQTNGANERGRFSTLGNLLLGGTSDTGQRLQVTGTMNVTGASTFGGNITVGTLGIGTGMFWDNTNNRLGIGTNAPSSQLHLRNTSNTTLTIHSTNFGSTATPVEASINFLGSASNLQAQISSQDRSVNVAGGWLYFRIKDASNVLQDRLIIDRTGAATFSSSVTANSFAINTSGQSRTITTFYASGSDGANIFIGGGGLSSTTGGGAATNGSYNTTLGVNALLSNTTGYSNTVMGASSMVYNTTGLNNSAFGRSSLGDNTIGDDNTSIGMAALLTNTTGDGNTALGFQAGWGTGTNANTTGSNNIFIGNISVGESATESNRTWIGNTSTVSTWVGGNLLVGTRTNSSYKADINGTLRTTQLNLSALNTAPATSSSTGTLGEIRIDADHIYVCTATNTWKRVAIATF